MNAPATPRPSVLQQNLKEKGALYAAYISSFVNGGIFIATDREFRLGDDVYLLLSLPDDAVKHPIAGKVGWVNPAGAGHRSQGIGVVFPKDPKCEELKARIENELGTWLGSDRPTQTI